MCLALTSLLSLKTLPCSHDLYPLVFKQLCCTVFKAFMSIDQEKKGLSAPGPPSSTVVEEWVPASPNLSSKNYYPNRTRPKRSSAKGFASVAACVVSIVVFSPVK